MMGFHVFTHDAGARVGSNGSQTVMCGYWFAAYAVAGRPESRRVCAWVANGPTSREAGHRDEPRTERNQPSTVAALIAFSRDEDGDGVEESGYCFAQGATIDLGLKFKPASDPMLADLVTLYQQSHLTHDIGVIDALVVERLSQHFQELLPHLVPSASWYQTLVEVAEVFNVAAANHDTVILG